ncbi:hypothetical protein [Candidatus Chloroploca sp. Khr17]|uniref:hypothetical protein n=1 Tax=Candidatus Chloroploca sp. Khr17 TaxID=2496869 RepID=UPI00101C8920|nr:hypothetical protein [Candidatus Chloroploca sp. Khr17]
MVKPLIGPPGTIFTVIGIGFAPGEKVGVYVTAPDGQVDGAPFQIGANGVGFTDKVSFETEADIQLGVWAMTFEGVSSGHKAIAYFRIQ